MPVLFDMFHIYILTCINVITIMSYVPGAVMGFKEDVRRAKAFTDESRLAILLALQNGEKCGCSLMELLKISQPTLSHHMKILCDSGLVICRKDGKWTYYSISPEGVESFKEMISAYTAYDNGKKCPNSRT